MCDIIVYFYILIPTKSYMYGTKKDLHIMQNPFNLFILVSLEESHFNCHTQVRGILKLISNHIRSWNSHIEFIWSSNN